jgi:hypothetical protein
MSGIAGSAIVNGDLDLFQYHWDGSTDRVYRAALGATDFTAVAVLETQVVDGGTLLDLSFGSSEGATAPEPFSLLLIGSGLIGLALWGRRGHNRPGRSG